LKLAGLNRSTFYYQRQAAAVGDRYADLKVSIRAVYELHKGRYGYRRITEAIRKTGNLVTHNTGANQEIQLLQRRGGKDRA
jgi:transposase InsO family protein